MKFKKNLIMFSIAAIVLSGCGRDPETVRDQLSNEVSANSTSENAADSVSENEVEDDTKYDDIELLSEKAKEAYLKAIDMAKYDGVLPDGTQIALPESAVADEAIDTATAADAVSNTDAANAASDTVSTNSVSGNSLSDNSVSGNSLSGNSVSENAPEREALSILKCAIADVNADQLPELIISHEDENFMNSAEFVYCYDEENETLKLLLSEFNGMEFFRSGNIKVNWSYNLGLSPNTWPFNIYTYDHVKNEYKYTGYVDAWESKYNKTDYEGNEFPTQYDKNKNGILYSIHYKDEYEYGYIHDEEDLQAICDNVLGTKPVELNWQ